MWFLRDVATVCQFSRICLHRFPDLRCHALGTFHVFLICGKHVWSWYSIRCSVKCLELLFDDEWGFLLILLKCAHFGILTNYLISFPEPLLLTEINYNPSMDNNYIHHRVWTGITYPFPNFNGAIIEFWEWIRNFSCHTFLGMRLLIHTRTTISGDLGGCSIFVTLSCCRKSRTTLARWGVALSSW